LNGVVERAMGQFVTARKHLEQAEKLDPNRYTGECQVLGWNQVCLLARRRVDNSVAISIQRSTSVFISS
jgi:hypothetical protein